MHFEVLFVLNGLDTEFGLVVWLEYPPQVLCGNLVSIGLVCLMMKLGSPVILESHLSFHIEAKHSSLGILDT